MQHFSVEGAVGDDHEGGVSSRGLFAHVDGLDPGGDIMQCAVVGEGGDDAAGSRGPGLRPAGPAVGDDDDGVGVGFGRGADTGGHVSAARACGCP